MKLWMLIVMGSQSQGCMYIYDEDNARRDDANKSD